MPDLLVAPCTFEAAKHAVMRWHYSQAMPSGKLVSFGVWEHGQFVGAVIYGRGPTPEIGKRYNLDQTEVCELVRVAMRPHDTFVSQAMASTLRQLRNRSPGLRLVVSFADEQQGHHGGIYQAGNWLYLGTSSTHTYRVGGKLIHPKSLHAKYGKGGQSIPWLRKHVDPNAERVMLPPKHRYVYPLDKPTRRRLTPHALPYPHAEEVSEAIHHPTRVEGQVQSLDSAPNN